MSLGRIQKVLSSTLLREDLLLEPHRPGVIVTKNIHLLSIQDERNVSLNRGMKSLPKG
jgi:hypothetical protein